MNTNDAQTKHTIKNLIARHANDENDAKLIHNVMFRFNCTRTRAIELLNNVRKHNVVS